MSGSVWYDQSRNKWVRWDARRNKWRPLYPWWRQTAAWLAIAMMAGAFGGQYRAVRTWTPLQRAYIVSYGWSALAIRIGLREGAYNLLWIRERTGTHVALDSDVERAPMPTEAGQLLLGNAARLAGPRRLEWTTGRYPHALVYGFLRTAIYRDCSVARLLIPALWGVVVVLLAASLLSIAPPTWRWLSTHQRCRSVSDPRSESASLSPPGLPPDAAEETPNPLPIALGPASAAAPTQRSEPSATPTAPPPTPFFE